MAAAPAAARGGGRGGGARVRGVHGGAQRRVPAVRVPRAAHLSVPALCIVLVKLTLNP